MSEEAEVVAAILDGQWSIFMKARNLNNTHMMRTTLMQAASSQLLLQELVGFDKMMAMLDNWSARDKLDKLEAQITSQQNALPVPMTIDKDITKMPAQGNQPPPKTREDVTYLKEVPGGSKMPNAHLPPPPPPPLQPLATNRPTTSHPQGNSQPFASRMDDRYPPVTHNPTIYRHTIWAIRQPSNTLQLNLIATTFISTPTRPRTSVETITKRTGAAEGRTIGADLVTPPPI
jgi:hypothetical protein